MIFVIFLKKEIIFTDPFGASANFASVIPPNKTISSPPSKSSQNRLQKSQTTANVSGKGSQSLARPWGSPTDPFGANSSGGTSSIPRSR